MLGYWINFRVKVKNWSGQREDRGLDAVPSKTSTVDMAVAGRSGHTLNKLCEWRHNMPPPPASSQFLRIYSPGGGAGPACWLFKTSATS